MPEGVGYGINEQFSSAGKSVIYIGKHLYALSGNVTTDNNAADLLNFKTGNSYAYCDWEIGYGGQTGDDYQWILYLNEIAISSIVQDQSKLLGDLPRKILIPPQSTVRITGANVSDTTNNAIWAVVVGRVYG